MLQCTHVVKLVFQTYTGLPHVQGPQWEAKQRGSLINVNLCLYLSICRGNTWV